MKQMIKYKALIIAASLLASLAGHSVWANWNPHQMKLDSNISAVVTGGASGLGAATARALAAEGVRVALFDLNKEKGEALA